MKNNVFKLIYLIRCSMNILVMPLYNVSKLIRVPDSVSLSNYTCKFAVLNCIFIEKHKCGFVFDNSSIVINFQWP